MNIPLSDMTHEQKLEMGRIMVSVNTDVLKERDRQNKKWGLQHHDYGTWLQILIEEVGEVAQAMQKAKGWGKESDADDLYTELVHVSAVACAIAEQVREEQQRDNTR
jgi:NTP pyrophosphatase (non-canonical NTP hydrolase)